MDKHIRVVAFGCIALAALIALAAPYWGVEVASGLILAALTSAAAGWGLLRSKAWAALLAMALAALLLLAFPIGTALGGYALWVLFSGSTNTLLVPVAGDTRVTGVDTGSQRILKTTLEWGLWRIVKTMLAVAHSAAAIVSTIGLVMLYAGPAREPEGLALLMPFLALYMLALPWSIPLYFVSQSGPWKEQLGVMWTLLILTALLNTGLLWFWALRRKRSAPRSAAPFAGS